MYKILGLFALFLSTNSTADDCRYNATVEQARLTPVPYSEEYTMGVRLKNTSSCPAYVVATIRFMDCASDGECIEIKEIPIPSWGERIPLFRCNSCVTSTGGYQHYEKTLYVSKTNVYGELRYSIEAEAWPTRD